MPQEYRIGQVLGAGGGSPRGDGRLSPHEVVQAKRALLERRLNKQN